MSSEAFRGRGAWNGESPSEGIVDIIDPGEGSTPLFFIIVSHTIIIVADGHYLGKDKTSFYLIVIVHKYSIIGFY